MSGVQSKQVKYCSSLRSGALVIAAVLACGWVANTASGQTSDSAVPFDIPAQPLGTALNTLAVQADLQIFFEQGPVAGLQAPAINGSMSAKQALTEMLANTQLTFTQNADGTLVVSQRAGVAAKRTVHPPPAAAAPETATPVAIAAVQPQSARDSEGSWMVRARALYLQAHNKSDAFLIPGSPPSLVPENGARANDRWTPELDAEYFFSSHWSTELAITFPQKHDLLLNTAAGGSGKVGTLRLMPNFLTLKYNFLPDSLLRPYLGLGVNVTSFYGDQAGAYRLSETTGSVAAQGGFDIKMSDHLFFNADVKFARARPVVDFDGQRIGHLKVDPLVVGIGVGYRFGGSPAVAPLPVVAPATSPPPPPLDSDGDGVPDTLDQCPNTPHGVHVDGRGCQLDSDHDGVPDYLDQCPGTPEGLKVDARGCEIEEMVLKGVTFETASSTLSAQSSEVLDTIVATLRQRHQATAEIHGYTDDRGSDAYNLKLSQRRAAAVVGYLTAHGIPVDHLSAKGFGKSNPVATNATAEGRAENRRVTVAFSRPELR